MFFAGCERAVAGELNSLQQDPDVAWFMDAVGTITTPRHTTKTQRRANLTNLPKQTRANQTHIGIHPLGQVFAALDFDQFVTIMLPKVEGLSKKTAK